MHNIKELEKVLPSVASINGMQVKDYLQALSDEGQIHVEKIGSGNWYWSFLSEESKTRSGAIAKLREEKDKIDVAVHELDCKVKEANEKREGEDGGRQDLVSIHSTLQDEMAVLNGELEQYRDGDPGEVVRKREEVKQLREKAERWTDNVGLLEGWLLRMLGGDRGALEDMRRGLYEGEYVEGEGLREL